jgi:mycofactocin precursor
MTEPETTIEDPTGEGRAESPARPGSEPANAGGPLVEADLLVEEVSIDGMCGVY